MLDGPVSHTIDASFRRWVHFISDAELRAAGFQFLTARFELALTAWDRALLWMHRRRSRFKYQWLIEDDVAWEPEVALAGLIKVPCTFFNQLTLYMCILLPQPPAAL